MMSVHVGLVGLVGLFFIRFFFPEVLFDIELGEQSQTYTKGDDKPEEEAIDIKQVVGKGTEANSDKDESAAKRGILVRFLFTFRQNGLGGFEIGVILNECSA